MPEPRIWILPPEVAERIAAGEVVERPASVVKELLENALDAGARRVTVETEMGGKRLIRVTDDGCGMTPEEVAIALQRHATSKIRSAEDLFQIHTLGFRGEALPSITAVSELEILTRTPDAAEGSRIRVVGGVVQAREPAAAQVGTAITVRRLFFNVPVREKFLRSDQAEANQITDWLQRLALSRPEVSFRLVHDGREALLSPGSQDPLNAVVAVLGRQVARDLLRVGAASPANPSLLREEPDADAGHSSEIRHSQSAIQVRGFVGRPTLTRANRGLQHFYVNGRAVRSPLFYRALDDAFRATMPQGRYPVAVLFVDVPPEFVDVNVHPAKTEVRFQDEPAVHAAVLRAVQSALASDAVTVQMAEREFGDEPPRSLRVAEPGASPVDVTPPPAGPTPFADTAIGGPRPWTPSFHRDVGTRGRDDAPAAFYREPVSDERGDPEAPVHRWSPPARFEVPAGEDVPPAPQFVDTVDAEPQAAPAIPELHLLGQAQDLFILAEGGGRFWVIDQHVAHERVLFDRITAPGCGTETAEPLLIPATIDVDQAHAMALDEHRTVLEELGFATEPFGPGRYRLRAIPRSLVGRDYETAFRDLADELAERWHGGPRLRKEEVAAAAAGRSCKRAVKAGQKLSTAEITRLLEDLRGARNPYTCPHGRPVFLTFEPEEIAQLFGDRACE